MMQDQHMKTVDRAQGQWKGILMQLGVPANVLTGKHTACPLCSEGKDRFRFDNQQGRGTWICSRCGAGEGMSLALKFTGRTFGELATEIDEILGVDGYKPTPEEQKKRAEATRITAALRDAYQNSEPMTPDCRGHRYFEARGIGQQVYPPSLRFAPAVKDGTGSIRPAILATVGVPGQSKMTTLHRTFLSEDCSAKAVMEAPRKLMPFNGIMPNGVCVELWQPQLGGVLGVAEGLETAFAASALYGLPVWSCINTSILKKWQPPIGIEHVAIFGDNDASFAGHAAAYTLAHRLKGRNIRVDVHFPDQVGMDFNDVLVQQ